MKEKYKKSSAFAELSCTRQDLNLHGSLHTPLKRTCLPFHHWCITLKYFTS